MLEAKDVPKIVDKGFELAKGLLDPDTFYSIAQLQKEKKYGEFTFHEKTGKLTLSTPSGIININPDKITEQGVAICKSKIGDIFFEQGGRKGIAMDIRPSMCGLQGEYIGSEHTHPGGSPIPSTGDLIASTHNKDQIMCIASKVAKGKGVVQCYVPKSELIPEEIMEAEQRQSQKLVQWREDPMKIKLETERLVDFKKFLGSEEGKQQKQIMKSRGINIDELGIVSIPVYDMRKTKWFTSSLREGIEDFYEMQRFERDI